MFSFSNFKFIDSVDIDILTKEKASLSKLGIDPKTLIDCSKIFCPINIRNIHWTLLVMDRKTNCVSFLDPLPDKSLHSEIVGKAKKLLSCIINETGLSFPHPIREYNLFYEKQSNKHDCGPFICAYAEKISTGKPIRNIDARRIRYLTYCHLPNTTLAPLLEGGSNLDTNPNGGFPAHLLQFDDSHIASFAFTQAESKTTAININPKNLITDTFIISKNKINVVTLTDDQLFTSDLGVGQSTEALINPATFTASFDNVTLTDGFSLTPSKENLIKVFNYDGTIRAAVVATF